MDLTTWAIIVGLLLILMALSGSLIKRLPLSLALIYLIAGYEIGPAGLDILDVQPFLNTQLLEKLAEITLLITLFSAGLKLRLPLNDRRWLISIKLAGIGMLISILLLTLLCYMLGFSLGVSLLIAAILAPTDPALASSVQVEHAGDKDLVRFCLTGESGMNDAIAFPFVILALELIKLEYHQIDFAHWFLTEMFWVIPGGIVLGSGLGAMTGRAVLYLRTQQKEAVGLDEFLVLGLIALSYGLALALNVSGFLSVFCAGLAFCRTKREQPTLLPSYELEKLAELATDEQHARPLVMMAVRGFNEQLERIAEVTIVLIIGAIFTFSEVSKESLLISAIFFLLIRPLAVNVSLIGFPVSPVQRRLVCWFGIRGVGSIFYLFYAANNGLSEELLNLIFSNVMTVIALSIVLHGVSVTPLMNHYRRWKGGRISATSR